MQDGRAERVEGNGPARPRDVRIVQAGLVLLVAAVFGRVAGHGFVAVDDPYYVYANPDVLGGLRWSGIASAFTSFRSANWHPVTWISHMLDVELFGLAPGGHHVVS